MEAGVEWLASAGRALDKVRTGLKLVDTVLKIGEGAGLPLIPAVCSAARGVFQVVQASRTVINDVLSAAQRTIDVLELLQLMAQNVKRMDVTSRASVEDRMRELQRLLEDVRSAVAAFGKKGWLRHALNVKRGTAFSQLDSEITSQLDLLLQFYNLARDADILDRLQAREYAVEAEVERQVAERKGLGEAVDAEALEKDCEVVRGIAVASGVSDAEFQEELSGLRSEMRDGFASTGVKLDEIKKMMAALGKEPDHSSRMSLYAYDRKPEAPPGQKDKLAARLGKGSFGVTYRMRKVAGIDTRRYAVKMIESEDVDGASLEKEARLLSMIEHENTLRFYDAFWHDTDDSHYFVLVTELLTGGSLVEKIAAAPPPHEVAALTRQVASGLAYMHSLNLQHRDLKPVNVMLDATGRAKIIDFGLACVSSASHRSRTKTKVGTNAYMSPEKTAEKRYGPADDVWAVGCILAELLLGRTIGNVALDPTKRQRAIAECKSASESLGSWVEGSLQETPGRRPAAAVLEQGLASGGPGAQEAEERSRQEAAAAAAAAADEEERVRRVAADRSRREQAEEARAGQKEEEREAAAAAAAAADEEERVRREAADRARREAAASAAVADEKERVRREALGRSERQTAETSSSSDDASRELQADKSRAGVLMRFRG